MTVWQQLLVLAYIVVPVTFFAFVPDDQPFLSVTFATSWMFCWYLGYLMPEFFHTFSAERDYKETDFGQRGMVHAILDSCVTLYTMYELNSFSAAAPLVLFLILVTLFDLICAQACHRMWLGSRYDYLFRRDAPFEVVRRFPYTNNMGDKLKSFGFFEFFARKKNCRPQDILEHRQYIWVSCRNGEIQQHDLIYHMDLTLAKAEPVTVLDSGDHTTIAEGRYRIYGGIQVVRVTTSEDVELLLLFRNGPHYRSFMEKF